ncbi:tryptophan dimethylallyltransferase 1 [Fusarium heterosporum]|uniref:Tryptophan dimethylallyltransferase 1 n=1 Tax=Fusarium heterosporum TaxID=42747 RepID=A0A8H5T378_FUSHE|nr:tryptophan dimethylallyltransferase 1 [Fusarium heterosporum]
MSFTIQEPVLSKLKLSGDSSGDIKSRQSINARVDTDFDIHQQYWHSAVGNALSKLLSSAGYSTRSQSRILYQFVSLVAPYLGASPIFGQPPWKSFMTDNHTPVELSWDFHTGTSQPMIRYSMEPISLDAGTASNPHNETAATDFTRRTMEAFPDTDATLFDHFQDFFNRGWTKDTPEGHSTTMFWAFDLKDSATTNKAYFFPGAIAHATNTSTLDVVSAAIYSAPGCVPESMISWPVFTDFVNQRVNLNLEMDMLALDLVPLGQSRLKVYFRDRRTNFNSVTEMMSLGGKVHGHQFDSGIRNLKSLWQALLNTNELPDDASLPQNDHRTAGILYNVEFRAHSELPKVKIYIPVRHYAQNDMQIISALRGFLKKQCSNLPDAPVEPVYAEYYSDCLQKIL